jgi:chromosome segregation ATPase
MSPIVADFTPLSASAQVAIVSLLAVLLIVLNILALLRRKPPLDTELVKLNSAIDGLQKSVDSLNATAKEHADHDAEITALKEKVRTLESARETDLQAQRKYTRETTHEIFEKLDELKDSVNANFQSVERAMGQLEGKVEALRDKR